MELRSYWGPQTPRVFNFIISNNFFSFFFSRSYLTKNTPGISFDDRQRIKKQATELVNGTFLNFGDQENRKRMFLATIAIHGIHLNLVNNCCFAHTLAEESMDLLRMYFTATRDAFLSVFEVRSILYACFKLTNKLHLFDIYCQEFSKLMPECPAGMEPRKLTHLARCQIRESLNSSKLPLPIAIDKLLLSKILKRFLLGEIADISIRRESSSSQNYVTQSELALLLSERHTS